MDSSACSQALQGTLSGVPGRPGDAPDAPVVRRGRSGALPRRSRDAFGTLLDATGRPERVLGAILKRFWVSLLSTCPRPFLARPFACARRLKLEPGQLLHSRFFQERLTSFVLLSRSPGLPVPWKIIVAHSALQGFAIKCVPEMILEFSRRVLGGCSVIARHSDARRIL